MTDGLHQEDPPEASSLFTKSLPTRRGKVRACPEAPEGMGVL